MFIGLKKIVLPVCALMILAGLSLAQQPVTETTKAVTKTAPRGDSEIEKCIQGRLAGSEKLRDQQFVVRVSNSEATFTGAARNAGSKGAATRIGQTCGATKITNMITAPAIPRPPRAPQKQEGTDRDNR